MSRTPRTPAPAASAVGQRTQRRMMWALLAAGFATFAQLYAMQAMLPEMARDLGADPAQIALAISVATLGLAAMVLVWTLVATRIGRLRAMQWAAGLSGTLSLVTVFAPDLSTLLWLRLLTGALLGGVPALAIAYVHEQLDSGRALAAAASYISGTTIGGAAGRLIAGPLAGWLGWRGAFAVVAGLGLVAAVLFVVSAPGRERSGRQDGGTAAWFRGLRDAATDRGLRMLYLQGLILMGVMVAVFNYTGFRLESAPFSLQPAVASLIFAAYFGGTVTSRVAGGWIGRIGPRRVALVGVSTMGLGLLAMTPDHLAAITAGLALFTGGFFAAHATCSAWVGARAQESYRSQAGALYNIALYLGSGVIGWAAGLLYLAQGWTALGLTLIGALVLTALPLTFVGRTPDAGRGAPTPDLRASRVPAPEPGRGT